MILPNLEPAARADILVGSNRTNSVLRFDECSGKCWVNSLRRDLAD
jgi:hypothetical protein